MVAKNALEMYLREIRKDSTPSCLQVSISSNTAVEIMNDLVEEGPAWTQAQLF